MGNIGNSKVTQTLRIVGSQCDVKIYIKYVSNIKKALASIALANKCLFPN